MEDIYNEINNLISSNLPYQRTRAVLALLEKDDKLREEFKILLYSREYLKTKSTLVELENDADQSTAREQVEIHFKNKKNT